MIYRPLPGSSLNKEDAQIVGTILEELGSFTPLDIVNAARSEASALHPHFDWNDVTAAEKYRLTQARHIVNSISVVVEVDNKPVETRAFHSITIQTADDGIEQRYTAIRLVSANPDMRSQVIENALRELDGWRKRYEQYQGVFGTDIFAVIQRTTTRVRRSRGKNPPQPGVSPQ